MSSANIRNDITTTLAAFETGDFAASSKNLLQTLGYRSERIPPMQPNDANDFIRMFPAERPDTNTEKVFSEHIKSVSVIFQVTSEEIANSASSQQNLFTTAEFDEGRAQSFVFVAAELKEAEYARGQYARFVREINKRFPMPIVALFRASLGNITLAFVNRRANKRDSNRDVLGNVSLIREIDPRNPHRAHLDILSDLSLDDRLRWMDANGKTANFDGLLAAWLDTLDTQELNKRFYNDLYGWFERAISQAKFPKSDAKHLKPEEHVIRLITRMLFVWFVKEKGLIANDLFIENRVRSLLKDYERDTGDSYYRAVLQNLFFATLNTEIDRRGFSRRDHSTHRDPSLYRYKNEISDADSLLDLFAKTPFINGGLFDCLDTFEATGKGGYRIDYFTDNPKQRRGYSIPNRLFFGAEGIIDLFNRYKFTVEENTPAEQEVALDPELLGKVFENLLAAYNPETRETARKQTGSYYTPRAIVDYMVDEALIASLSESALPDDGDREFLSERLRYLLDYADAFNDAESLFSAAEREAIVRAIAEIKILDPAVGSGAFPMSMLHKLTLALRRLDEHNELWETLQIETASERARAAFHTSDQQERNDELREISDTFEKYRASDFGRKLYLIQNSIFGVDIQPVATQIAKLRFFISLAIEQQPDSNPANNYGIKPLPNLETRFVAANTLLALSQPAQLTLGQTDAVSRLQQDLDANRERHFHANTRNKKIACRNDDARLRQRLAKALRDADFDAADADKIAAWDPYDQNANANWFDAEYMFGITDGFDVVIGNPPYIQLQKNGGELGRFYKDVGYQTFARTGDIYQLFYERGISLAKHDAGYLCYISSNQWMRVDSGRTLRNFVESQNPIRLVNLGADVFENATVNTCVLLINRSSNKGNLLASDVRKARQPFPPDEWTNMRPPKSETWVVLTNAEQCIKDKIETTGTPLKDWDVSINRGALTGYNKAFIVDTKTKDALVAADAKSAEIIKPVLRGQDIPRYQMQWADLWLITTFPSMRLDIEDYPAAKNYLLSFGKDRLEQSGNPLPGGGKSRKKTRHAWFEASDTTAYHENFAEEKIVWGNLNNRAKYSYAPKDMFISAPTTMLTPYSPYLLAVLNSTLMDWYFQQIGVERDGGYYEYKPMFIRRLPIPKISADEQRPYIELVDRILQAKAADPDADTSDLEESIDWLVYELYDLTDEETAVVEDAFWEGDMTEEEEDAALVRMMEEALAEEGFVSEEEIMAILRAPDAN